MRRIETPVIANAALFDLPRFLRPIYDANSDVATLKEQSEMAAVPKINRQAVESCCAKLTPLIGFPIPLRPLQTMAVKTKPSID